MERAELEGLDRESLVVLAERAGIKRARILTRPEMVDELLRLDPTADRAKVERARGFFGRARDLLSRVVERGLHLPDAADRIVSLALGGPLPPTVPRVEPQALPTVTLAEIYAAQGHKQRAVDTLRRVLEREPEHVAARALLARLEDAAYVAPAPPLPPEPEIEARGALDPADDDEAVTAEVPTRVLAPDAGADADAYTAAGADARADAEHVVPTREVETPSRGERPYERDAAPSSDECVAVPTGPGAVSIAWRVRAPADADAGALVVRAVVITPTWDGPRKETRDLPLASAEGALVLRGLPEPSVVRAAVGRLRGERFTPLATSPAFEARRAGSDRPPLRDAPRGPRARSRDGADDARRDLVRWTVRGPAPVARDDPRAAAIERAFEAARGG
jgi:hypothetical protein